MNMNLKGFRNSPYWRKNHSGLLVLDGKGLTDSQVRKIVNYGIKIGRETLEDLTDEDIRLALAEHCRNCDWSQAWECGSKVFYYCGTRKSNRTDNGLRKIKLKDVACQLFRKKQSK